MSSASARSHFSASATSTRPASAASIRDSAASCACASDLESSRRLNSRPSCTCRRRCRRRQSACRRSASASATCTWCLSCASLPLSRTTSSLARASAAAASLRRSISRTLERSCDSSAARDASPALFFDSSVSACDARFSARMTSARSRATSSSAYCSASISARCFCSETHVANLARCARSASRDSCSVFFASASCSSSPATVRSRSDLASSRRIVSRCVSSAARLAASRSARASASSRRSSTPPPRLRVRARLGGVALHTLQRLHELADASLRRLGRGGGRLRLGARGGVLLGRRELTGGDERVGLGLEEFLESRLQASVGLRQRGVFGAGHAQVQLALAPRRAKLRLGGTSFVKRQAFLRRAGHLPHVQLECILLLSRSRLLGDGGLQRLPQAHLANLQHGQPRVRRGQRLLQAALRAGFESLHERLRVVRLYAVRLRLRLGAARAPRSAARSAAQPALARTCSRYSADRVDPISVIACLYLATSDTSCSS